jgi:hypothetical protein
MRSHISTSPIRLPNPAGRSLLICVLHRLPLWALVPKSLGSILSHALRTPFVSRAPRTISFICLRTAVCLFEFSEPGKPPLWTKPSSTLHLPTALLYQFALYSFVRWFFVLGSRVFLCFVRSYYFRIAFVLLSHCFRAYGMATASLSGTSSPTISHCFVSGIYT